LLSFGKPPLVLSKLPIQAKTGASVMDAFFFDFSNYAFFAPKFSVI
jgi:hypothetical protein